MRAIAELLLWTEAEIVRLPIKFWSQLYFEVKFTGPISMMFAMT